MNKIFGALVGSKVAKTGVLASLIIGGVFVFGGHAWAATANVTQLGFTTTPQTISAGAVSAVITVQTQNASGTYEKLDTSGTHVTLQTSSPTGQFSSNGTTWGVTSLTMASGSYTRHFYYKDSTAGTFTLTVSNDGWTPATQSITINPAPCSSAGSTLLVDSTQQVSNDPDSGVHGNWAMDTITKRMQVWLDGDGTTYCGQTTDTGTFVTNGTITPESGSPLPQIVNGTFSGGARYIIHGTFLDASSTWPLTGSVPENTCGGNGSGCPSGTYSQWVSNYFSGETHSFAQWGWTYTSSLGESWTNADVGDSGDIHAVFNSTNGVGYPTIQAAVSAASPGDVINVGSGTYSERVLINAPLTLVGVGGSKPVISGTSTANYIIKVDGTNNVVLDNLEINGGDTNVLDYGVLVNNSGTNTNPVEIKNSVVKNIWDGGASGIGAEHSSYVSVHDNTISKFDKNGIRFVLSQGKFYSNEVIGDSVDGTNRVQNLVNLRGGSNVEIYGNTLHGGVSTTPGSWDSPGIFVSGFTGGAANPSYANIHDNQIYNNDDGIVVGSVYAGGDGSSFFDNTDTSNADIVNNNIHDVHWGINFEQSSSTAIVTHNKFSAFFTAINAEGTTSTYPNVNAENNWWGVINPNFTSIMAPAPGIDFSPWCLVQDCSVSSGQNPVIILNGGSTMNWTYSVGWSEPGFTALDPFDGDITASTTVTSFGDPFTSGPHTITYSVTDSHGNSATVTRTVTVSTPSFVGGGGGGGGGFVPPPAPVVPVTPAVLGVTTPAAVIPTAPTVAGASTVRFASNLGINTRGDDVKALQQFLLDNGYFKGPVTGFFGPLTRAAVIRYQRANGIPGTGFVGVLTRAKINAQNENPNTAALQAQIASLKAQIQELLNRLSTTTVH